jgi:hypothetical protein
MQGLLSSPIHLFLLPTLRGMGEVFLRLIKRYTTKTYEGPKIKFYTLFISALIELIGQLRAPATLPSGGKRTGNRAGLRAGLNIMKERIVSAQFRNRALIPRSFCP